MGIMAAAGMGVAGIMRPRCISLGMRCMVEGIEGRRGMWRHGIMGIVGGMVDGTMLAGMVMVIVGGGIEGGGDLQCVSA